jgi:hypothetical protein
MKNTNIKVNHKICVGIVSFLAFSGMGFASTPSFSPLFHQKRDIHSTPNSKWSIKEYEIVVREIFLLDLLDIDTHNVTIASNLISQLPNRSKKGIGSFISYVKKAAKRNPKLWKHLKKRLNPLVNTPEDQTGKRLRKYLLKLRKRVNNSNNARSAKYIDRINEKTLDRFNSKAKWPEDDDISLMQIAYEYKKQASGDQTGYLVKWKVIDPEEFVPFRRSFGAIAIRWRDVTNACQNLFGMDALAYLCERVEEPTYQNLEEKQAVAQILRDPDPSIPGRRNVPLIRVIRGKIREQNSERKRTYRFRKAAKVARSMD